VGIELTREGTDYLTETLKETFVYVEKNETDTYDEIESEPGNAPPYPETLSMIVGHTYDFTGGGKHDALLAVFDDTVASREGGMLTVVSCGTTVVAIQDADGFYTCSINVYDYLSKNLTVGESLDLNPLLKLDGSDDSDITVDGDCVTLENGVISAVGTGHAAFTVKGDSGINSFVIAVSENKLADNEIFMRGVSDLNRIVNEEQFGVCEIEFIDLNFDCIPEAVLTCEYSGAPHPHFNGFIISLDSGSAVILNQGYFSYGPVYELYIKNINGKANVYIDINGEGMSRTPNYIFSFWDTSGDTEKVVPMLHQYVDVTKNSETVYTYFDENGIETVIQDYEFKKLKQNYIDIYIPDINYDMITKCEATSPEYAAYHINDLSNNGVDKFTEEDKAAMIEENKNNILSAALEYIEKY
jgi:hypothetical protein